MLLNFDPLRGCQMLMKFSIPIKVNLPLDFLAIGSLNNMYINYLGLKEIGCKKNDPCSIIENETHNHE